MRYFVRFFLASLTASVYERSDARFVQQSHLAVLMALHQYFLVQRSSPVPAFLVLDQPSQVYFPKRVLGRTDNKDTDEEEPRLRDEDVSAVRMAFDVMGKVVLAAKGQLQLIVLDHASQDIWGDVEGVVGLPEWRNGVKLVPMDWLDAR